MVGSGSSGNGGEEGFTGRAAIGYDHGHDGEVFYLGLALDERCVEGWVEGCLERMIRMRNSYSVTSGRMRPGEMW
jgi:hypothetical protein